MKTKVFITVDTEFGIAGTFADPVNRKPVGPQAVLCEIGGRSHGLGFLLDTLSDFRCKATFFVEALNTNYFGDPPMRDLALRIKASGHDVQLHLHPCWTYFKNPDWTARLKSDPPSDYLHGRSLELLGQWLGEGIETFERWGVGRPIALRTGNLTADRSVYRAMESAGVFLASNIAIGMYRPEDTALQFYSGVHRVGNVIQLCVLSYADFTLGDKPHIKILTVTGSSWNETRTLLQRAYESNVASVVILTHPFEYMKVDGDFNGLSPNRINQGRLSRLCKYLRDHADRYEVCTFADFAASPAPAVPTQNVLLRVPVRHAVGRMVENALNDKIRML